MRIRTFLITSTALSILVCSAASAQQPPQTAPGQPSDPAAKEEPKGRPPGQKQPPQAQPGKQTPPPAAQGQPAHPPGQPPAAQGQAHPPGQQPPGPARPSTAQEQPKQPLERKELPRKETQQPPAAAPGAPGRAQGQPSLAPVQSQPLPPAAQPPAPTAQEKKHEQPQRPAQGQPPQPQSPTAQQPSQRQQPAQGQPSPQPPAAQGQPGPAQPPAARTQPAQPQPPAAQTQPAQPQPPAAQTQPAQPQPPAAQTQPAQPQPPAAQTQPAQPQVPTAQQARPIPPAAQGQPIQLPGTNARRVDELRGERRETREGNRVVIQEPDRTIIREGGRTIIRHNEVDRFRYGARDVRVERQGAETVTVIERPDGARIVTVTDANGRLVRRMRRDPAGREVVIIDNRGPASGSYFVDLPPPTIRMPRERYIVEAERASEADIYETLVAQPVERLARRYTLDEIRYSPQVRERMPRVDIDTITFETGSWEVAPDQAPRLSVVAAAIKRAISRNPSEVFLIEGHTDAVGPDVDNLSLSDRRAESVALVLTEQFQVPAENLTSQGYGEQQLKVQTDGPERQNRRVTMRRITPLLGGDAPQQPGG